MELHIKLIDEDGDLIGFPLYEGQYYDGINADGSHRYEMSGELPTTAQEQYLDSHPNVESYKVMAADEAEQQLIYEDQDYKLNAIAEKAESDFDNELDDREADYY